MKQRHEVLFTQLENYRSYILGVKCFSKPYSPLNALIYSIFL